MLAIELARRGVEVSVLDKQPARSSESRAIGIQARTESESTVLVGWKGDKAATRGEAHDPLACGDRQLRERRAEWATAC